MAPWKELYASFIEAWGLRLRPGITIDDMANVLAAVVDGLALRAVGNPSPALIDHERKQTVLGIAALALVYSFMEPGEKASGLTLEQAVQDMTGAQRDGQEFAS